MFLMDSHLHFPLSLARWWFDHNENSETKVKLSRLKYNKNCIYNSLSANLNKEKNHF